MMQRTKPELLVTAKDINQLQKLIESGVDAVTIGSEKYGLRITGNFTLNMIKEALTLAHKKDVKVYILMNAILHNEDLEGLDEYIEALKDYQADAIVFGDPAVYLTAKELAPEIPLHWSAETVSTNYETVKYWAEKGVTRAFLARELSLEEVVEIKKNVDIEIQAQIHGMTCIFHSKRNLITNYHEHISNSIPDDVSMDRNMFLKEHQRPDENYPVFEDYHGTHVMSSHDICMIDHLIELISAGIDSLKIDGIMQSPDNLIRLTKLYREAIDKVYNGENYDSFINIIKEFQPTNRPLTTGFYYKEQYY